MIDTQKLMLDILPIAREAGRATIEYFRSDADVMRKDDGSPVTRADQASEKIITAGLADIVSDIPVVGEESVEAGYIPDISAGQYFLVDPLDGTKAFIAGEEDYSVNIAFLENNQPVMGLIYAPMHDLFYMAANGRAWRQEAHAKPEPIQMRPLPTDNIIITGSKSYGKRSGAKPEMIAHLIGTREITQVIPCSGAIKFGYLAEGRADIYPRFGPTSEWDTAAGQAVVEAAGGIVTQMDGRPLIYGKVDQKFLNPHFVAHIKKDDLS